MKGVLFSLIIVLSIGLMQAMGQQVVGINANTDYAKRSAFAYQESNNSFTSNVMLNEISPRAFRHFKRNYPSVCREQWWKSAAGFTVAFTDLDSSCYVIHYDRKGRYENCLIYYQEKHIPINIDRVIKYLYGDYAVSFIAGMNDGTKTVFNVALTKKKMVKTVEISGEGEVRMVNEYENALTVK